MIALVLFACKPDPVVPDGALPVEGTRHELATVEFNLWVDYIPLFGATDASCRWLDPHLPDDTTPWPPLQAFWVIYENDNDVDITELSDVYFEGDRVGRDDFAPLEGYDALGFKIFSGFQTSLLNVDDIRRSDEGRTVEADFGNPVNATVRLEAIEDGQGCAITTLYCEDDACEDGFSPLEAIELDLGAFYTVQDIRFREPG